MASSSGNGAALQASILRFVSAHEAVAERTAAQRQQWKRDAEAMNLQISAMEETIVLLEREVKHTTASLAKIEALDKRGGLSSGSTAADMELLLGQLEDKLTRTQADLEEARRATYFPFVEGYQLRFSYDKNYLGFRELLLEQLRGTLSLKLVPGSDAAGNAQVPSFQARFDGPGEGLGKEPGAHLHFLGAGMSLVTRREMLGVALAPNISFGRIDVSARFIAHIPIVYFPRRRSWRAASGFKIEILHFRADTSESASGQHAGTEALLRMLVQAVVEGVVKHLLVSALGPAFGEYLLGAQHGADVVMELVMQGVPIRTFDAPLGGPTDVSRHAALLLGLRQTEVAQLLEVQSLIPPSSGASFRSLADLMRYYHTTGMHHQPERRRQLAALWQDLLDRLPNATAPPADMASVFERLAALAQKPAQVTLKVRALKLHLQLEAAVGAVCDGVAAHLACSGAEHGSAKTVLDRFRVDSAAMLAMLRRCLGHASAALRGELRGGPLGQLRLSVRETAFEGALHFSRIISPPAMKAYALLTTVLPNGCVQLQLSLPDATGAASEPLLTVKLGETRLVLLAGKAEVLYLSLVRMNHAASAPPPSAPSLPPLHLGAMVAASSAEAAEAAAEQGEAAAAAASHSSSPKRAADAPPLATPPCRLVVLYENQRRLTMLRTYTASDLLPLDPGRFSDEAMKAHYNKLEDFPLPSAAGSAAGWEWCGDWHIDFEGGGKADDGWQYAFNWNTGWLSASNPITHVRRRRWVRQAMWTGDPFAVPTLDIAPTAEGKTEGGAVGGAMMAAALMTAGAAAVKSAAQVTCNGLSSSASRGGGRGGSKMEGFGSGSARGRGAARDATPPAGGAGGAGRVGHTPPAAPAVESFASPASSGVERHLAEDILGLARAATALQMTMADGARMRVHVEEVELSSIVSKLVEHGTELLQELLESHPWYKDPLQKATHRIHQHLGSDQLSIEVSISVSAAGSTSRGSSVSVESASGVSETCATFHNEINLMDFVADVQEIYRAFTGTLTSQNSTFASGLRKVATMTT